MIQPNAQESILECSAIIQSSPSLSSYYLFYSKYYDNLYYLHYFVILMNHFRMASIVDHYISQIDDDDNNNLFNILAIMLQEEINILDNIQTASKHQNALLKIPQTPQQEFFHLFAQRHLIKKKLVHAKLERTLSSLPGTFSNLILNHHYLTACIENRIQLSPEEYPLIGKLITWAEKYPSFKAKSPLNLMNFVFQNNSYDVFEDGFSLITFINMVSQDILKLIRKKGKFNESQLQKVQNYNVNLLEADDLLNFLNASMPKVLFNVILSNSLLPGQKKKDTPVNSEYLYKISSLQYYLKTKANYSFLMRILIRILLYIQLKPTQQKKLMEIIICYFYAFHHDKKSHSTDFFIEAYNKLDQTTRFAMSDQFLLFFRVTHKIGKSKFLNFLLEKSTWLKDINNKISDNHLVGYPKDGLVPYNAYPMIGKNITINNGQKTYKYFEILEDYSLFYYKIGIKTQDITFRLFYLGQFNNRTSKTMLIQKQKQSGQIISNILAIKRGLYMFEFDNSYSWLNKKIIRYQNIILSPLQLKSQEPLKWINSFYQNVEGNEVAKEIITVIPKPTKKKQEKKFQGICNISKNGHFLNLKLTKGNKIYEFQSSSDQKIIKKFNQLLQTQKNIKWLVDSEPIDTDGTVLEKIKDYSNKNEKGAKNKESKPKNDKKVQRISEYFSQSDKADIQEGRQKGVGKNQ